MARYRAGFTRVAHDEGGRLVGIVNRDVAISARDASMLTVMHGVYHALVSAAYASVPPWPMPARSGVR